MSPFIPPDYIDNDQQKLGDVLHRLISEMGQRDASFASGYFEPYVWRLLGPALVQLHRFRLLLGREPQLNLPQRDLVDLRRYYGQKLRGDLEHLLYSPEHARLITELAAFLRRDSVEVRLSSGRFMHAKAYIFPNYAIVGSSNFTPSGLRNNAELSLVSSLQAVARDLRQNWFEPRWAQAEEYKSELIAALESSKFGNHPWTPHDVFIKTLYEYFRERLDPEQSADTGLELAEFQREGLHEAIQLIDTHGGALVADAVGLGKTYIGLGLLEHYLIGQRRRGVIPQGLVICPAQLRTALWEPQLRTYQIAATLLSMEELGRQEFDWKHYANVDVVLVDESHNFRNPSTTRYRNLARLLAAGKRKKVALLSATPINNTIWDLYHQILLIARNQEDTYRDAGIADLRSFFSRADKGVGELFDLLEVTTVRRSRRDVRLRQQAGEQVLINGREVQFPQRQLGAITYDLDGSYAGFYNAIASDIERLTLVAYNIEQFKRRTPQQAALKRNTALIGILKTLLLKRLESSVVAFEATLRRQQQFQQAFYETLVRHGKLLDSAAHRRMNSLLVADEPDEVSSSDELFAPLLQSLPAAQAGDYDIAAIEAGLNADLAIFNGMLGRIEQIRRRAGRNESHDDKLEQLKAALLRPPLASQKLVIFSYYAETARYLHAHLTNDEPWRTAANHPHIGLITGQSDSATRDALVRAFAPGAHAGAHPNAKIDILIATDVLSEGQNLQDAAGLINYDLHWNPVRMIQRAGRIDRIGSPHATLHMYNCFPEAELDHLLGLVGRLQTRIATIGRSLGNDASILGEVVRDRSLDELRRLRACDQTLLATLEDEEALFSGDDMRLPLLAHFQQLGEHAVNDIPLGIHSGRGGHGRTGVFFAFRARDRHFWRYYDIVSDTLAQPALTDRRQIFALLACPPDERRKVAPHIVWPWLEQATRDVLQELQRLQGQQRAPAPLSGVNQKLYQLLAAAYSKPPLVGVPVDVERRATLARLLTMLQQTSLKPFERDHTLRQLQKRYADDRDLDTLIAALDVFAVEHRLYEAAPSVQPSTWSGIAAEELELISYELFSP